MGVSVADKIPEKWKTPELIWRSWEGESVVYHVQSADTHLLNPTAAIVLQRLQQSPATSLELTEQLAVTNGLEPDQDLFRNVEKLLSNFHELGLIEPVS